MSLISKFWLFFVHCFFSLFYTIFYFCSQSILLPKDSLILWTLELWRRPCWDLHVRTHIFICFIILPIILTVSSVQVISVWVCVWELTGSRWTLPFILYTHVPPSASFYQDGFDSNVYLQPNVSICFVVELVLLLRRSAWLQEGLVQSFKPCMKCKYVESILWFGLCLFIGSSCLQSHPDSFLSVYLLLAPSHRSAIFPDASRPSCPLCHGGRLLQRSQMSTGWWDAHVEFLFSAKIN